MRKILFVILVFSFTTVMSQTVFSFGFPGYSQGIGFANNIQAHDRLSKKKWYLNSYRGLSTGISFFNGDGATFLAAPIGLQLNRRLNYNFYAFANVTVVPAFVSLNPSLINTSINKNYQANPFMQNNFNVSPSVSMGLMYINDAKTFSISGSISAERNNYFAPPYYQSNRTQNPLIHTSR